jgi:hypothetical protein
MIRAGRWGGEPAGSMRVLILLLSAVVLALAVSILLHTGAEAQGGQVFTLGRLISDGREGEEAVYSDGEGNTLAWSIAKQIPGGPDRPPFAEILRVLKDRSGTVLAKDSYRHMVTVHGVFPLMAPQDPTGYDRCWVWTRLRREAIDWRGKTREAWRFDLIDPALPSDSDTVVAWMDEEVPVFGIVRWQRGGRTWTLSSWRPQ